MKMFSDSILAKLICVFALSLLCSVSGCDAPGESGTATTEKSTEGHDHGHDHDHGHSHSAPHGGQLIDVGRDHAYHAEIHDNHDNDVVTIYMYNGNIKPLVINVPSVSLTLTAGDKSGAFDFIAKEGGSSDQVGASEFTLKNEEMMALLDTEGVKGILRVNIDDKPFTGKFEYQHQHHHDH